MKGNPMASSNDSCIARRPVALTAPVASRWNLALVSAGIPAAVVFVLAQVVAGELLSLTDARIGYRLLEWTSAGARAPYVVHVLAIFFALPLTLSQLALPLRRGHRAVYDALGTLNIAQSLLLLVTGYVLVLRARDVQFNQIYTDGTLALLLLGVGAVFALAIVMCVVHRLRGDLLMYRVWNLRLLWLTIGFVFHRIAANGLQLALPHLDAPDVLCASFGLSSIWAFLVVEYGMVTRLLRNHGHGDVTSDRGGVSR